MSMLTGVIHTLSHANAGRMTTLVLEGNFDKGR